MNAGQQARVWAGVSRLATASPPPPRKVTRREPAAGRDPPGAASGPAKAGTDWKIIDGHLYTAGALRTGGGRHDWLGGFAAGIQFAIGSSEHQARPTREKMISVSDETLIHHAMNQPEPKRDEPRWLGVVIIGFFAAVALVAIVLALFAFSKASDASHHQVSQATSQISVVQTQSRQIVAQSRQISGLQAEVGTLRTTVSGLQATLTATSPTGSVITCTDLQQMGLQNAYGVTVDNAGSITLNQTPAVLPGHCFKR